MKWCDFPTMANCLPASSRNASVGAESLKGAKAGTADSTVTQLQSSETRHRPRLVLVNWMEFDF